MSDILQSNVFVMTLLDLARDNFVKIIGKKQVTVTFAHNNLSVTYEKTKKGLFSLLFFLFFIRK
jgi:hypothetical protein